MADLLQADQLRTIKEKKEAADQVKEDAQRLCANDEAPDNLKLLHISLEQDGN